LCGIELVLQNEVSNTHQYFFFTAEDGIRDFHVTGVQTCALPIYQVARAFFPIRLARWNHQAPVSAFRHLQQCTAPARDQAVQARSEERLVGKECSSLFASLP